MSQFNITENYWGLISNSYFEGDVKPIPKRDINPNPCWKPQSLVLHKLLLLSLQLIVSNLLAKCQARRWIFKSSDFSWACHGN